MVTFPELPRAMLIEPGEELREKPAVVPVTVSITVVVCVCPPPVPVTVMVYVPATVEDATVMPMVDDPLPVIDVGLKLTVTPDG